MNSKERVEAAIRLEEPDRLPVDLHNFLVCAELMKMPYGDVFNSPELIAESHLKGISLFGHDMVLVEAGVATLAESCGCELEYPEDAAPCIKKPILGGKTPKEIKPILKNLDVPDPAKAKPLKTVIDAVRILLDKKGDELFIMGRADQGPFSLACELRGMNDFLLDLATEEDYIEDLLEYTSEVYYRYANALLQTGAHATSMGESVSGPSIVSPDIYRKYAMAAEKNVINRLHQKNYIVANHICGKVDAILADMVTTGADILELDHETNFELACREARGKTCLLGPVSPTTLSQGTPQDVKAETIKAIEIMKGNPGFILGPGCAMGGSTNIENIKMLVQTAREYGKN